MLSDPFAVFLVRVPGFRGRFGDFLVTIDGWMMTEGAAASGEGRGERIDEADVNIPLPALRGETRWTARGAMRDARCGWEEETRYTNKPRSPSPLVMMPDEPKVDVILSPRRSPSAPPLPLGPVFGKRAPLDSSRCGWWLSRDDD